MMRLNEATVEWIKSNQHKIVAISFSIWIGVLILSTIAETLWFDVLQHWFTSTPETIPQGCLQMDDDILVCEQPRAR